MTIKNANLSRCKLRDVKGFKRHNYDMLYYVHVDSYILKYELPHFKTNKMTRAPSEDSDQPGHLPSLIRVFAVRSIGSSISPVWSESFLSAWRNIGPLTTYWAHSEDWSDWADSQADLSLRWAHVILLVLSCGSSYFACSVSHIVLCS